jgi:hypothetical protein
VSQTDRSTSTTRGAEEVAPARLHRGRVYRRIATAAIGVFLVLCLFGWLGLQTRTMHRSEGSVTVDLTYSSITRRGLATPWEMQIHRKGGFDGDLTVSVSEQYLSILDLQEVRPQPDSETSDDHNVTWTFSQPSGDSFTLSLDAQADPGARVGRRRGVAVVTTGSDAPVRLPFSTWMVP